MEMWRGRTPFLKGRTLRNGRQATATVKFCLQGSDSNGSPSWSEIKAELEVTMPTGDVAPLRGLFNGDRKASPFVWPAMQLPVKLHPDKDDKLVIDWKAWEAEGGVDAAKARGSAQQAAEANASVHGEGAAGNGPSQSAAAAPASSSGGGSDWQAQSLAAWQQALASGQMSQAQYDKAVADLRRASDN